MVIYLGTSLMSQYLQLRLCCKGSSTLKKALHRDGSTLRDNIDCLVNHTVSPVEL